MNKRVDCNQAAIINALRSIGCTVQDLSQLGKGCPDVLIGYKGRNYLVEIKNAADRSPRLTVREEQWIRQWRGQVSVITTSGDAIAVLQDGDYENSADQSRKPDRG